MASVQMQEGSVRAILDLKIATPAAGRRARDGRSGVTQRRSICMGTKKVLATIDLTALSTWGLSLNVQLIIVITTKSSSTL